MTSDHPVQETPGASTAAPEGQGSQAERNEAGPPLIGVQSMYNIKLTQQEISFIFYYLVSVLLKSCTPMSYCSLPLRTSQLPGLCHTLVFLSIWFVPVSYNRRT